MNANKRFKDEKLLRKIKEKNYAHMQFKPPLVSWKDIFVVLITFALHSVQFN